MINPSAELDAYQKGVQSFITDIARQSAVPGIWVEVRVHAHRLSCGSGVVATGSERPLGSDSRFAAGCITKLLLAVVVLRLAAERRLDLTDPVAQHLPELRAAQAHAGIQIAHMLSHTSGYQVMLDRARRQSYSWEQFVDFYHATRQLFAPGTVFSYSHTESAVLGQIVQRVASAPPLKLVQELVLEPLGIVPGHPAEHPDNAGHHTRDSAGRRFLRFAEEPLAAFWEPSSSRITLTLSDILDVAQTLMGGPGGGVLQPAQVRGALCESVVSVPRTSGGVARERTPLGFTLGCAVDASGLFGRDSNVPGQAVTVRFDPRRNLSFAIGMNAAEPRAVEMIAEALLASLGGESSSQLARRSRVVPDLAAAELVGEYVGVRDVHVVVRPEGAHLLCSVRQEGSTGAVQILMVQDEAGEWLARSETGRLALAFFREPHAGTPCLMVGSTAFRKSIDA